MTANDARLRGVPHCPSISTRRANLLSVLWQADDMADSAAWHRTVVKVVDGQEVKFCCAGCVPAFDKDPAAYLAKLAPKPAAPAQPKQP